MLYCYTLVAVVLLCVVVCRCVEAITTFKLYSDKRCVVIDMIEFLPECFKVRNSRSVLVRVPVGSQIIVQLEPSYLPVYNIY